MAKSTKSEPAKTRSAKSESPKTGPTKPAKKSLAIPVKFSDASLVASSDEASRPIDLEVEFTSGIGQVSAVLFRHGVLINMQSISTSGTIRFSEVQASDAISVNGVCAGKAVIKVTGGNTNPPTPETFNAQIIMTGYIISF